MQGDEAFMDQCFSSFLPAVESSGDQGLRTNIVTYKYLRYEWIHNHLRYLQYQSTSTDEMQLQYSADRKFDHPRIQPNKRQNTPESRL